jgi:hypothetical protein
MVEICVQLRITETEDAMTKRVKILLGGAAVLVAGLVYAQRAPEFNELGEAFLRVNINPTNVPPMVNINPYNLVPRVEVTRMPEIQFKMAASGCQDPQSFRTGIGKSISGPLMVTYLNFPQQAKVTISGSNGSQPVTLNPGAQITTAIFLQAGQRLDFDSAVLYSGCG